MWRSSTNMSPETAWCWVTPGSCAPSILASVLPFVFVGERLVSLFVNFIVLSLMSFHVYSLLAFLFDLYLFAVLISSCFWLISLFSSLWLMRVKLFLACWICSMHSLDCVARFFIVFMLVMLWFCSWCLYVLMFSSFQVVCVVVSVSQNLGVSWCSVVKLG
jgi:hypothetical protein